MHSFLANSFWSKTAYPRLQQIKTTIDPDLIRANHPIPPTHAEA